MSSTCGVRCNGVGVPKKVERWSGQGRKSEGTDVKDRGAPKNKREQEKERPRTRETDKETEQALPTWNFLPSVFQSKVIRQVGDHMDVAQEEKQVLQCWTIILSR